MKYRAYSTNSQSADCMSGTVSAESESEKRVAEGINVQNLLGAQVVNIRCLTLVDKKVTGEGWCSV